MKQDVKRLALGSTVRMVTREEKRERGLVGRLMLGARGGFFLAV